MNDILVPVCDLIDADRAANRAIALYRAERVHIYLLNVQRPLPKHIAQFFNRRDLQEFHRDAGMRVLEPAMRLLDQAGVPHEDHVLVGHQAETIVKFADDRHCQHVVMEDARPRSVISMLGLCSIVSQVRHLMNVRAQEAPASGSPGIG